MRGIWAGGGGRSEPSNTRPSPGRCAHPTWGRGRQAGPWASIPGWDRTLPPGPRALEPPSQPHPPLHVQSPPRGANYTSTYSAENTWERRRPKPKNNSPAGSLRCPALPRPSPSPPPGPRMPLRSPHPRPHPEPEGGGPRAQALRASPQSLTAGTTEDDLLWKFLPKQRE